MTERSTRQELEQKYLTDADRHIADAAVRIAALRGQIADLERNGSDASAARDALEAPEPTLQLMVDHRALIARMVEILDRPDY